MGVVVVSVVVALVVAVVVAGIVVVGMRGELPEVSEKAPELAGRFEWAARHLSGAAAPSKRMADLENAVTSRFGTREPVQAPAPSAEPVPARTLPATGDFGRP
ncbi:hypothetical protein GA0111570_10871 [Raineyella antarctica]|uniref:Uncharacterized protein n=1 Tax=Raineyella antarctica TaxID=1577474 RepID=A0A1G6HAZ1_9ACTN|nr:hypothetical protein [Raineyella antarctica]SDB91459.1 hypothetical protein GA0111570_10871 [Raineyella antarctica]